MDMGKMGVPGLLPLARLLLLKNLQLPPAERDWGTMENAIAVTEKALPNSVEVPIFRGDSGDAKPFGRCRGGLAESSQQGPQGGRTLSHADGVGRAQQDWAKTERLLEEYKKLTGDTVDRRLTEADYIVRRGDSKAVERLQKLGEKADRFSDADRMKLWSGLAGAAAQVNDLPHAKLFYQRITEKEPYNIPVRYRLWIRL